MNPSRSGLLTLLLAAVMVSPLQAQPDEDTAGAMFGGQNPSIDERMIEEIKQQPLNVQVGATFMVTNPQDSLRRAIMAFDSPSVGYGFGLTVAYHFDPVPIVLGGELAMNFFGGTSREFYIPRNRSFDTLSYSTLNFQMPVTFHARFQPNLFTWVHPYIEGDVGFMLLSSTLNIETRSSSGTDTDNESQSSVSWLYGGGAGVMVKFADIINLPSTLQRLLFDVRFRYMLGTSVNVPSIRVNEDRQIIRANSTVDNPALVYFNIGIAYQF